VNGTYALVSSARSARSGPVKVFAGSCQVPLRALLTFTLRLDGCVVNYIQDKQCLSCEGCIGSVIYVYSNFRILVWNDSKIGLVVDIVRYVIVCISFHLCFKSGFVNTLNYVVNTNAFR